MCTFHLYIGLPLLAGGDIIEVRSMIGTKMSDSFVITYQFQNIVPTLATIPVCDPTTEVQTDLVILFSNVGQIVYTTDGSGVLDATNSISPMSILYYSPIQVTSAFTLKAVSFDRAGNFSAELVGKFAPAAPILPLAITLLPIVVANSDGLTLSWTKPDDASISSFGVEIFTPPDVKVGATRVVVALTLIINDLIPGIFYQFSVFTQNTAGSSVASPKTIPIAFPEPTDTVLILTATYRLAKNFKITGTGTEAATVTLYSTRNDGTIGTIIFLRGTTTPISAPVECFPDCGFVMNVRNAAVPSSNPGRIFVVSSRGGVSGPFVVVRL